MTTYDVETARNFTWFGDFAEPLEDMPEEDQAEVVLAVVRYGMFGVMPDFGYPKISIFKGMKKAVDNSLGKRAAGSAGGKESGKSRQKSTKVQSKVEEEANLGSSVDNSASKQNNSALNPFLSCTNPNKKEINKEKDSSETKSDNSHPRCSLCGSTLTRRFDGNVGREIIVCSQGHVCNEKGVAKNHKGVA